MKIHSLDLDVRRTGMGPPFLWAHGLTGSMAVESVWNLFDWAQIAERFEVVRYDARGHGGSEASLSPEDYRWSRLADDMLDIASSLGFGKFSAGGMSMGCATSLFAALQAPQRVRALVLAAPPTAWEKRAAQAGMYDQLASFVESRGLAPTLEMLRQKPILPSWALRENPAMNDAFLRNMGAMNLGAVVAILRGAKLCQLPSREEVRKMTQPALILAWPDDPSHPLEVAEELHSLLPHSRLEIATSLEQVRGWTEHIRQFLMGAPAHVEPELTARR